MSQHTGSLAAALALGVLTACSPARTAPAHDGPGEESPAGTVRVDGADLSYAVVGDGANCIFIGSAIISERIFTDPLRDHLRCVLLDARPFVAGATTGSHADYTIGLAVADIEQARRSLGMDRIVVGGHSIWGLVAVEYARRHPEHTSHAVLIGTPPVGMSRLSAAADSVWATRADADRKALLARNLSRSAAGPDTLSPAQAFIAGYVANGPRYWFDASYDASPLWRGVDLNMELTNRLLGVAFRDYDLAGREPPLSVPVFVAMGRHDYVVPVELWTPRQRGAVDRFVVFERSGHTPILEEPDRFASELVPWLEQQ